MGRIVAVLAALLLCSFPAIAQDRPVRTEDVAALTLSDVAAGASKFRVPLLIGAAGLVLVMLWAGDTIKPGSLKRSGLRDVKPLPWTIWLFAAVIVMLSFPLAVSGVNDLNWANAPVLGGDNANDVRSQAVPLLAGSLVGMTVAFGMVYIVAKSAPNAGLKAHAVDWPIGLGLFVLALPIVLLLGEGALAAHEGLTGANMPPNQIAHPLLATIAENGSNPWAWALIAVAVLAVPVIEEVAYRIFLQSAIFRATNHVWAGIIITSIIFAAMHLSLGGKEGVPWYAAVSLFALGLSCGLAYERTKRLCVPIAMHVCFNALNIILALSLTA